MLGEGALPVLPPGPARRAFLAARLRRLFPALAGAYCVGDWGGRCEATPALLASAGGREGTEGRLWWAGGFCGHGMALALWSGEAAAGALLGRSGAFEALADLRRGAGAGGRLAAACLRLASAVRSPLERDGVLAILVPFPGPARAPSRGRDARDRRRQGMSPQDRQAIDAFLDRIRTGRAGSPSPWATPGAAPEMSPVDPAAEAHILAALNRTPGVAYRLAQTAFAQEAALVEAQNRIQRLEWEAEAARREAETGRSRGLFGFGVGRPAPMPPRPVPQRSPMAAQMAARRGGSGFLATAAATAASVAGGMVLGSLLADALGGGTAEAATAAAGGVAQDPSSAAAEAADLPQDALPADEAQGADAWEGDEGSGAWGEESGGFGDGEEIL